MRITDLESFIKLARIVHGDRFDYSESVYVSAKDGIDIICRIHGKFSQSPTNHVRQGNRCPECSKKVSKHFINRIEKKRFNHFRDNINLVYLT